MSTEVNLQSNIRMIIRTRYNRNVWLFVLCSSIKWPLSPLVMLSWKVVLRPETITDGIALELPKCSRCSPFYNNECVWFCTLWKIGISRVCKGHCFYQMKVTADKSKCLSASGVKQTKETGFSPSLECYFPGKRKFTFYNLQFDRTMCKMYRLLLTEYPCTMCNTYSIK